MYDMNKEKILDLIIIGAGPIGLACGIEASGNSLEYLIIEKGCLVNSIFHYPTNMTFFSTSDKIEIGGIPFVSHGIKPTRREALEYYRRVCDSYKLNVNTYEIVSGIIKSKNIFKVTTDKRVYRARKIIVATGYYDNPNLIGAPGENLSKVKHYFDEPHPYAYHNTAVVGAGNSAIDVALELFRIGADVTMIIREPEIKSSIKYWVKPDIENRIKEGSIKAFFNSEIIEIKKSKIKIKTPSGIIELKNDFVFLMTGYHPDFKFLKKIKIGIDKNNVPVYDRKTFESNIKGVYLAGVICGGKNTDKFFIENSIGHSKTIVKQIVSQLKDHSSL